MATATQAEAAQSSSFFKTIWTLVKQTFEKWREDNTSLLAAALAYYTVFALPPVMVIAIIVAGVVIGQGEAQTEVVARVEQLIGPSAANLVQTMIVQERETGSGTLASIVSIATLVVGATTLFTHLQGALNQIWGVEDEGGSGIVGTVRKRALSFILVVLVGLLLIGFLVLSSFIPALRDTINELLPISAPVVQILNLVISMVIITLLFAVIYKVLPDVEIPWGDVWVGALVTAVLFAIGNVLLGIYIGMGNIASTYGAAGALILLLVWVYYSSLIFFFGAEFTEVYAEHRGEGIVPTKGARLIDPERARRLAVTPQRSEEQPKGLHPGLPLQQPRALDAREHQTLETPPATGYMPPEAAGRTQFAERTRFAERTQATEAGEARAATAVSGAEAPVGAASSVRGEVAATPANWPFEVEAPGAAERRRNVLYPALMVLGMAAGLILGNAGKLVGRKSR